MINNLLVTNSEIDYPLLILDCYSEETVLSIIYDTIKASATTLTNPRIDHLKNELSDLESHPTIIYLYNKIFGDVLNVVPKKRAKIVSLALYYSFKRFPNQVFSMIFHKWNMSFYLCGKSYEIAYFITLQTPNIFYSTIGEEVKIRISWGCVEDQLKDFLSESFVRCKIKKI